MAARMPEAISAEPGWQPAAPVTFVGTPMPYRIMVLHLLHEAGVPLAVYGKYWLEGKQAAPDYNLEKTLSDIRHYGWIRLRAEGPGMIRRVLEERLLKRKSTSLSELPAGILHGFVPDGCMSAMFASSDINLGFTRMTGEQPDRPGINQVKLRDFEVPLAGGFYMVEKASEYEQLFTPGKEVETWETSGELLDKIGYYLRHPTERAQIAAAGAARASTEHTWEKRFTMLFRELGLQGRS
jgi:spore maturation protein CgeB